jgi:hypothetical protein
VEEVRGSVRGVRVEHEREGAAVEARLGVLDDRLRGLSQVAQDDKVKSPCMARLAVGECSTHMHVHIHRP